MKKMSSQPRTRAGGRMGLLAVAVSLAVVAGTWGRAGETPTPINPADYAATIRVACVGDSITAGSGIKEKMMTYPAQLGRMLGDSWEVRNFGVSGATMLNAGDRPYQRQKAFSDAIEFRPDVVIIKLGTNDSKPQNWEHKDDFAADARSLIAAFRKANPKAKIDLCLPVPAFPGFFGITEEVIASGVIPRLEQVADEEKLPVIDLHTA